jgi:hypothetical protein
MIATANKVPRRAKAEMSKDRSAVALSRKHRTGAGAILTVHPDDAARSLPLPRLDNLIDPQTEPEGVGSETELRPDGANVTVPLSPLGPLCVELKETSRHLNETVKLNTILTNMIRGHCRGAVRGWKCADKKKKCGHVLCKADKKEADLLYKTIMKKGGGQHPRQDHMMNVDSLLSLLKPVALERKGLENTMTKAAEELPVAKWAEGVRGFGVLSLARIIAETGDLSNYDDKCKVWKRMGQAGAGVLNGKAQRRVKGKGAVEQGFAPQRAAVMAPIGLCILRSQSATKATKKRAAVPAGPYRLAFDGYKNRILAESADGTRDKLTDGHAHNMALRWLRKLLLRNLWRAWNS